MKTLLIGGTGLISTGIVKHLAARNATITMLNRGQRDNRLQADVETLTCDRNDVAAFAKAVEGRAWDCVIDMICFTPEQAEASIKTFAGKTQHFMFCSTVCTYGSQIPPGVVVDETFPQKPISNYGKNKVLCERAFEAASTKGAFNVTTIRPSHTYGESAPLIDQLEFDSCAWDRIEKDLPVLCAGDGLGLWNSTHRDDVGKLFAYAAGNAATFGQSYNATTQRVFTWRDYYREAGAALGKKVQIIMAPAEWIVAKNPKRFGLLKEITQFHGPYTSAKAMRDVQEFSCEVSFTQGAKRVFDDLKSRSKWKNGSGDAEYQQIVDAALAAGMPEQEA